MFSMRKWHRWLGLGLGWLMLVWFISGAVMIYVRLPRQYKRPAGRLGGSLILDPAKVKLDFARAWERAGRPRPLAGARLALVAGRPAFIFRLDRGGYRLVWADSGEVVSRVSPRLARRAARGVIPGEAPLHYQGLVRQDQWTVGASVADAYRPLYKFRAEDGAGSEIYVSARTGEVCQLTTAGDRFWSWLGAIPHWLYFTVLRRHLVVWEWVIIVLSALGCLLCLTGLWLGIRYFSLSAWGRARFRRHSAFLGIRKWHHYLGLVFGLPTLALVFSGLMSMAPLHWCTPASPSPAQVRALSGGPLRPELCRLHPARALEALGSCFRAGMLRLVSFQGRPYLLARDGKGNTRLLPAWQNRPRVLAALSREELVAAARNLLPGWSLARADLLPRGDIYLPGWERPVLRVRYADPRQTWLYLDPACLQIVRRLDRTGRLNRWLYRFLHTLDLPWLLEHEPLRQAILLFLLAGGSLLCVTGPWSWLARRKRRRVRKQRALLSGRGAGRTP